MGKIPISLMYLSLDEKRCTFYVDYFISHIHGFLSIIQNN